MIDRLEATLKRYNEIGEELANPEIISDIKQMTLLSKERTGLEKTVEVYKEYKKELDDMPAEYKSTVKDSIDAEVWKGNDRKKVTKLYKDLGYDEDDPMILALDNEKGTILKPVKVKEESKLQEVEIKDGENTETITGLHTDLFKLVNMYQYQIADGIMCDRDELDATMYPASK